MTTGFSFLQILPWQVFWQTRSCWCVVPKKQKSRVLSYPVSYKTLSYNGWGWVINRVSSVSTRTIRYVYRRVKQQREKLRKALTCRYPQYTEKTGGLRYGFLNEGGNIKICLQTRVPKNILSFDIFSSGHDFYLISSTWANGDRKLGLLTSTFIEQVARS